MKVNITVCDINGNPIEPQKCSCGNEGSTFFQGKDSFVWKCNTCIFPDIPSSHLHAEWGGSFRVMHEGESRNMAEFLNEKRKIPFWHKKLQEELMDVLARNSLLFCLSPRDLLPFLSATITGQFAISDYSEEFVKETLDRIFEKFKEKRRDLGKND